MKKTQTLFLLCLLSASLSAQIVSTHIADFPGNGEMVIDNAENIYVTSSGSNGVLNGKTIHLVSPDGGVTLFTDNLPLWPVGIIFNKEGDLLVTGWLAGTISTVDPETGIATLLISGLNGAGSIEVDDEGRIYVVEYLSNRLLRYAADGSNKEIISFNSPIQQPAGLSFDKNTGLLYISNWTNGTISEIQSDGTTTIFAALPVSNVGPIKVYDGFILATSPLFHQIYRIDLVSREVTLFAGTGEQGNKNGSINEATFDTPTGIGSVDGKSFYIAESFQGRGRLRYIDSTFVNPLKEIRQPDFSCEVSPNPFGDTIRLVIDAPAGKKLKITLFKISGEQVPLPSEYLQVEDTMEVELAVPGLAKGQYLLGISSEGYGIFKKLVKG